MVELRGTDKLICPGRIGSPNLTALRGKQSALFADRSAPSQGSIPHAFIYP